MATQIVSAYPLSAIRYPLSAIRYPLSAIRYPPSAIRHPPSAIRHPMSLLARTFLLAGCLLVQGASDQARVFVFYSHAILESPMGARHVTFDLGSAVDRGASRSDVAAAFGRAGLPLSSAAIPGPDTVIVALMNFTTDSSKGTDHFYHFGVDSRRCVSGHLEHRKSTVSIRCNDQLCYRLDNGADTPADGREPCQ